MNCLTNLFRKKTPPEKKFSRIPKLNLKRTSRLLYQKNLYDKIQNIEGDVVECGVGEGESFLDWALILHLDPRCRRNLWGFDSFEGFPEPAPEDQLPNGSAHVKKHDRAVPMAVTLNKLAYAGIPSEWVHTHVKLIKGYFESSLQKYDDGQIALLHIDVDLYKSYKTVLSALYDKVVPKGIIAFDEYQTETDRLKWPGAKKAIDEFFLGKPVQILEDSHYKKYHVIKPS